MPEGHTVHRVARLFHRAFVGHRVHTSSPQGRFVDGAALLDGSVVEDAWAVGKQFFAAFSGHHILRVHLGIYGAWTVWSVAGEDTLGAPRRTTREEGLRRLDAADFPPQPVGQVRLRVLSDDVVADLRGPTACEVITPEQAAVVAQRLGPDPLVGKASVNRQRFIDRMRATSTPVGLALMNQEIVSGIGNVYRAELLFRHRLDPYQPAKSLDDAQLAELWDDWTALLKRGVKTGVMVTRDDLSPAGARKALRDRSWRHFVYKRDGQSCLVCGHEVVMAEMQARKLYYCPHCQDS